MSIKKKITGIKKNIKNWYDENKDVVIVATIWACGSIIYGAGMFVLGMQTEANILGGLVDVYNDMPKDVTYDVCVIDTSKSGLKHPWYFIRSEEDKVLFDEKYRAKSE